jgi:hypothetical protein
MNGDPEIFMLNVQIAETISGLIALLIAYAFSVTVAGWFAAWTALRMGDDTPEQEGFLTLNPMAHIDFLGTFFLLLYRFGWGKFIPMNPFNMHGRFRVIKILVAFLSKTFAHCVLGIFALILLILIFGDKILSNVVPLAVAYPLASSYTLSVGLILMSLLFINVILAVITCIANICGLAVMIWVEKHPEYLGYTSLIMLVIQVLLFYIFGGILFMLILSLIKKAGYLIASLLHLF